MSNYTTYQPEIMPPQSLDVGSLIREISTANIELGRYDAMLFVIPNPDIITFSLLQEEATFSSKIEGTQATLDEVLRGGGNANQSKRDDIQEINNYSNTLANGRKSLDGDGKITEHLVRALHHTLMDSVRGMHKSPGQIRKVQNYIGSPGSTPQNASFVPPSPQLLPEHLDRWLAFMDSDEHEVIIQTALMHAQFELLHPFLDGNGRLGRILIPLFLYQKKMISTPAFYISAYLENNRDEYYYRLRSISQDGDWTGWTRFFLRAVIAQCKKNNAKIQKIKNLYDDMQQRVQHATHSQFAQQITEAIFVNPYCTAAHFIQSGVPATSAYQLIKKLEQSKVLTLDPSAHGRRTKTYAFLPLLEIIDE